MVQIVPVRRSLIAGTQREEINGVRLLVPQVIDPAVALVIENEGLIIVNIHALSGSQGPVEGHIMANSGAFTHIGGHGLGNILCHGLSQIYLGIRIQVNPVGRTGVRIVRRIQEVATLLLGDFAVHVLEPMAQRPANIAPELGVHAGTALGV